MSRTSHARNALASALLLSIVGCENRLDPTQAERKTATDTAAGVEATVQCSGWFPDWISTNPPGPNVESFQLAQGYPLGVPIYEGSGQNLRFVRWDPLPPPTPGTAAWQSNDFRNPAQRQAYLDAIKDYALLGMPEVDFVAQKNQQRSWYHAPMMTGDPGKRREPLHGLTRERTVGTSDYPWIKSSLQSFAIGYYNKLGGYTLGEVYSHQDPELAEPAKAQFIDGTVIFKILFVEYDTAKIDQANDPLVGAPEWTVQDVRHPSQTFTVRLIQMDVAVKDSRSAQTGWVFATYVYDKNMTSEPVAWRRLAPIGLQWGNDPDVTAQGVGILDESWIAPNIPVLFQGHLGRHGRLNGPVDNPVSSCVSCHSTAQVAPGNSSSDAFAGARLYPANSCTPQQAMLWFRNIKGTPFGMTTNGGQGCALLNPQPAALYSTDYSLQVRDGLMRSMAMKDGNPCMTAQDASPIPPPPRPPIQPLGEPERPGPVEKSLSRAAISAKTVRTTLTADQAARLRRNPIPAEQSR